MLRPAAGRYTLPMPGSPPLILIVQPDDSLAEGLTLALQRRGARVFHAQRWTQARLLLEAAPTIQAIIAPCQLDGEDAERLLTSAARVLPAVTLIATCVSARHDHPQLPSGCRVWRMPFDGDTLDHLLS